MQRFFGICRLKNNESYLRQLAVFLCQNAGLPIKKCAAKTVIFKVAIPICYIFKGETTYFWTVTLELNNEAREDISRPFKHF